MATETPDDFIEWATSPTAETASPGVDITTGWALGDAPASSHFNYVNKSAAGWQKFVVELLGSSLAFGNIDYTDIGSAGTSPWGQTPTAMNIAFLGGRWYITQVDSGNGLNVFDSDDGETWNASISLLTSVTDDYGVTRPEIGQGQLVFGCKNTLYYSTDNTLENLRPATTPFAQISTVRELLFNDVLGYWVAVGTDGTNGKIERSVNADPSSAWSNVATTVGDPMLSIAMAPTGEMLAVTDNSPSLMASATGTWSAGPLASNAWTRVIWSDAFEQFLIGDDFSNLYRVDPGSTSELDTGFDVSTLLNFGEFIWTRDPGDEKLYALFGNSDITSGNSEDLGAMHIGLPMSFALGEFNGGQGKLYFPYGTTGKKALIYFGAKNNG